VLVKCFLLVFVVVSVDASPRLPSNAIMAAGNPPRCLDGSASPQSFLWNTLYDPTEDLLAPSFRGVPGMATQLVATGYDGSWATTGHFGLWPDCEGETDKYYTYNGGVPQALNMSKMVEQLTIDITGQIPDPNYDGIVGIDYEGWHPIWDGFLLGMYKNESMKLVKQKHPDWDSTQIAAQAEIDFNTAGKDYFLTVLKVAKSLRPKAKWGFYGTPWKGWHSYWDQEYAPDQRKHNDNMQWWFDAVDVIMPELYFSTDHNTANDVRPLYEEAERVVGNTPTKSKLIVPYTWERPGNWNSFLTLAQLKAQMLTPFEYPHTPAVLIWENSLGHVKEIDQYFKTTFGPMITEFVTKQCDCAKTKCSGHGRCVVNNTRCFCDEGFSGDNCSQGVVHKSSLIVPSQVVFCPDGISWCPDGYSCAQLSTGFWGCCHGVNATVCDLRSCCPKGTSCTGSTCTP